MIADKAAAKCHWHSMVEPVGNCTVCGQAGCGTCLVQEPAGYRCHECIRKGRQIVQPQLVPKPIQPVSLSPMFGRFDPKYTKILVSFAIFLVGVAFSFTLKKPDQTLIALTLNQRILFGYVPWALFWGAPTAWRLWRRLVFNKNLLLIGCTPTVLAWLVTAPLLLVFGGWFYCLFGGGIYQFLKHWWSLRQTV